MLIAGIVSDIYDGVLARRWGTSTPRLRRFDSNTDTLFWGCAGMVAVLLHADFLQPWFAGIALMFAFLVAQNIVNGFRYRVQPSYHFYSGKLWSLALVVALTGMFLGHPSGMALGAVVTLGIINSIEGVIASLVLPRPMTDIPTVFHALGIAGRNAA
jgi:CDP-diacylglycerol--glycerol-3-phosphate 3-phosphatidyltransferase